MCYRHLFGEWEVDAETKTKKSWRTNSVHLLSKVCSLQLLRSGVVGWGCCRLINLTANKKPAETAALALPPAVATLQTRAEGDQHLTISFHTAVLHQVRHLQNIVVITVRLMTHIHPPCVCRMARS